MMLLPLFAHLVSTVQPMYCGPMAGRRATLCVFCFLLWMAPALCTQQLDLQCLERMKTFCVCSMTFRDFARSTYACRNTVAVLTCAAIHALSCDLCTNVNIPLYNAVLHLNMVVFYIRSGFSIFNVKRLGGRNDGVITDGNSISHCVLM